MMSAQIIAKRGRSLGSKCCSSLPKMLSSNISSSSYKTFFSTRADTNNDTDGNDAPPTRKKHPQSFVQDDIDLTLGELETELPHGFHQNGGKGMGRYRHANDGRNSYWRPPWKNQRAEIISAEDFANRPRVTFSESFLTMHDAMAVLTWQSQEDKDGMYKLYIDMMMSIAEQQGKGKGNDMKKADWEVLSTNTSHEYIVRVVAQSYNVTTSRAAGVIQLQHNEEQLKADPDFTVQHALQANMDMKMRDFIRETYQSYGEKDPITFTEEPIASTGRIGREDTGSNTLMGAPELIDVDHLLKKTKMEETEKARVRIAQHIYVEDVDERTRKVKLDSDAKRLLEVRKMMNDMYEYKEEEDDDDSDASAISNSKVGNAKGSTINKILDIIDSDAPAAESATDAEGPLNPNEMRLYVGNLNYKSTEASVRGMFEQYGPVTECALGSKGYAFVTMPAKEAESARDKIDGMQLDGRTLTVEEAQHKVKEGFEAMKEKLESGVVNPKVKVPPKSAKKKRKSKKAHIKIPKNLKIPAAASPYPDNNRGWNEQPETRRPRWKYAAQIINTHDLEKNGKNAAKRAKAKRHGRIVDGNTIIEHDGELRVASVAELEQTSWKHVRNESEFMFKGVKDAWMRRQLEGEVGGWGYQEEVNKPKEVEGKDGEEEEKEEGHEGDEEAETDGDVEEEKEGDTETEDK